MVVRFGIGRACKVPSRVPSGLAPVALGARAGVRLAAIGQIHALCSFGAMRWQVLSQLILPVATPDILTAMRHGTEFGWMRPFAAETAIAVTSVGYHGAIEEPVNTGCGGV